jgi:hypothetical protein
MGEDNEVGNVSGAQVAGTGLANAIAHGTEKANNMPS